MTAPASTPSDTGDERPLETLHVHVRRLLAELDRVAGEASIPYALAYGTALGAVRGGDLVPWDPDADVWVDSSHHARLVEECARRLGPDFELLSAETHHDYEYLFPRLVLRGTHHVLLSLDVFPLDHAPRSAVGRRVHTALSRLVAQVFLVKRADVSVRAHYGAAKRRILRSLRLLAAPVPASLLVKAFRRLQRRRPTGTLVNSCGSYGHREYFDAAWFADVEETPLGPVPIGYDALLTAVYGDWRSPPPPERIACEIAHVRTTWLDPLSQPGGLLHRRPGGEAR